MEVSLEGEIEKVCDECTVVQSAAWTFTSFLTDSPCAIVYTVSKTLVTIHTHAGVTTDAGGTTAGDIVFPPLDATELAAVRAIEPDHIFTADITITDEDGNFMTGAIEGGSNCEVESLPTTGHGIYTTAHNDTENTVCTAFEITGVTAAGDFGETIVGDTGELCYTYDTLEPHNLLSAHIQIH